MGLSHPEENIGSVFGKTVYGIGPVCLTQEKEKNSNLRRLGGGQGEKVKRQKRLRGYQVGSRNLVR